MLYEKVCPLSSSTVVNWPMTVLFFAFSAISEDDRLMFVGRSFSSTICNAKDIFRLCTHKSIYSTVNLYAYQTYLEVRSYKANLKSGDVMRKLEYRCCFKALGSIMDKPLTARYSLDIFCSS